MKKIKQKRRILLLRRAKKHSKHNIGRRKKAKLRQRQIQALIELHHSPSGLNRNIDLDKPNLNRHKKIFLAGKVNIQRNNLNPLLDFIRDVNVSIVKNRYASVTLDFSNVESITPGACLIIYAEMDRCRYYTRTPDLRVEWPSNENAKAVMHAFKIHKLCGNLGPINVETPGIELIGIVSGDKTIGSQVKELLLSYRKSGAISARESKGMYANLIECLQNVQHHAYKEQFFKRDYPWVKNRWWMFGYTLPNKMIGFGFLDQGATIPKTLNYNWTQKIKNYKNFKFRESDVLAEAVLQGDTRLDDVRRGTGLPKLRDFINKFDSWHLQIFSGKAHLILKKGQDNNAVKETREDLGSGFQGTLVFLEMKVNENQTN